MRSSLIQQLAIIGSTSESSKAFYIKKFQPPWFVFWFIIISK